MNEEQTKYKKITPALTAAGWDRAPFRLALEQQVAPGRIEHDGRSHKPERADYVLMYGTRRLAVVEAKSDEKDVGAGEAQARHYAEALGVRFAYATNGVAVRSFDLVLGTSSDVEFLHFPTPQELLDVLNRTDESSALEKVCREIPFLPTARYYQERAVEGIIRAIGRGQKNALVTLATGTGKTFIAYQLIKKLVEAKWCRRNGQTIIGLRKPRVLFLADRNILADQAKESFHFGTNECYCLEAGVENPPMGRTVYFTLYQTLLGTSESDEWVGAAPRADHSARGASALPAIGTVEESGLSEVKYKKFPKNFFDLVIVDECHRGGANDESAWRVVLDYFGSASHVGLTATPKCDVNGSTYAYFGEPVYQYSLREGVSDGFLTPYRVKQCHSTLTQYHYEAGDRVTNGEELDLDKFYSNDELEQDRIRIKERDRHFIHELFDVMPANEKALVFCVTQEHALRITHIIREEAGRRGIHAAHYCERVTADDGVVGEQYLKEFRNNENLVPTILTTSQKLSTGVDACNVRSIVLLKQVKSMVEFKQIIGRGTRLYDGKPYFTIYDFTDATNKFTDPDWDGPVVCPQCRQNPCVCGDKPRQPCPVCGNLPCTCPPTVYPPCPDCGCWPCICEKEGKKPIDVKLSSGRVVAAYWQDKIFFDDEMLTAAEFLTRFAQAVRKTSQTPELLRECWADMAKRRDFIEAMELVGFSTDKLREIQRNHGRQEFDVLDVMLDIAYDVAPVTRAFRAQRAERSKAALTGERKSLFKVILENYVRDGVWTLTAESFRDLLMQRYASIGGAYQLLGFNDPADAMSFYGDLQRELYTA